MEEVISLVYTVSQLPSGTAWNDTEREKIFRLCSGWKEQHCRTVRMRIVAECQYRPTLPELTRIASEVIYPAMSEQDMMTVLNCYIKKYGKHGRVPDPSRPRFRTAGQPEIKEAIIRRLVAKLGGWESAVDHTNDIALRLACKEVISAWKAQAIERVMSVSSPTIAQKETRYLATT